MPKEPRKHLDYSDRCIIEDGIRDRLPAREIARRLHVHPATVTREVLANRTVRVSKSKGKSAATHCANSASCVKREELCDPCTAKKQRLCRRCQAVKCYDVCPDFELRMCDKVVRWPYVCEWCYLGRDTCPFPRCRYSARKADELSKARRKQPRGRGASVSDGELAAIVEKVRPLISNGLSLEAIWLAYGDGFPVCVRTFYSYIEKGYVDVASLELPRKVRYKPRRKNGQAKDDAERRDLVDRTGRTYNDFMRLDEDDLARAVQMDTVVGRVADSNRILSIHLPATRFQLYVLLPSGEAASVVRALDAIEEYSGSRSAFEDAFGIILTDRGAEFSDIEGMERSVLEPGRRRCSVFFCDPMQSEQKPNCERNHEELRRILPKRRSRFDALTFLDVSAACSHVNSYPRKGLGGASPIDLASQILPRGLLEELGIEKVPIDQILLKPTLLPHAVEL